MSLNNRRREFEHSLKIILPEKDALFIFHNKTAVLQRKIAYLKGINGSDMELAEALWTFLPSSEEFEIDGKSTFIYFYSGANRGIY